MVKFNSLGGIVDCCSFSSRWLLSETASLDVEDETLAGANSVKSLVPTRASQAPPECGHSWNGNGRLQPFFQHTWYPC